MKKENCKINSLFWGLIFAAITLFAACSNASSGFTDGNNSSSEEDSSSSVEGLSSEEYSSSSIGVCTNIYGINTVRDCRDGQIYKTVEIGRQTWMAENLNYIVDSSCCYKNSANNCSKYGRLYTWTGAMNIAGSYQSSLASAEISDPHQGACPTGWHIPKSNEWATLGNTVGGLSSAGTKLKSTSEWNYNGNGTDDYGFSALPAGGRYDYGVFNNVGEEAYFWSASENGEDSAYYKILDYDLNGMYAGSSSKRHAFSVRCIKN